MRILSRQGTPFTDRVEAGGILGQQLTDHRGPQTLVLGIPRGGVVVADSVALVLDAEADIVLSRKVGAPGNPELAVGAVSEDGHLFHDAYLAAHVGANQSYLDQERLRQVEEIRRRTLLYRNVRPKVSLAGRTVIITDDGLATGSTMQAALWSARRESPGKLICAVPVAPEDTLVRLAGDADEIIGLRVPAFFGAVGQFYRVFDQTEDEEVLSILSRWGKKGKQP